jgi:hypothetical protein
MWEFQFVETMRFSTAHDLVAVARHDPAADGASLALSLAAALRLLSMTVDDPPNVACLPTLHVLAAIEVAGRAVDQSLDDWAWSEGISHLVADEHQWRMQLLEVRSEDANLQGVAELLLDRRVAHGRFGREAEHVEFVLDDGARVLIEVPVDSTLGVEFAPPLRRMRACEPGVLADRMLLREVDCVTVDPFASSLAAMLSDGGVMAIKAVGARCLVKGPPLAWP